MIFRSKVGDPYTNLAIEHYLFSTNTKCLFLYRNSNSVIIGRNQNPWKELNYNKILQQNTNIVRRHSGGGIYIILIIGTVYHVFSFLIKIGYGEFELLLHDST
jgi:lipoate-protein ligase A